MTRRADDLELLRAKLLLSLGAAKPSELPAIAKELRAIDAELEALTPPADADSERLDELRNRRAGRQAAS